MEGVRAFPGLGLEGGQGSVLQEVGGAGGQAEERELQAGRLGCAEEGRVPCSPGPCSRPAPGTLLTRLSPTPASAPSASPASNSRKLTRSRTLPPPTKWSEPECPRRRFGGSPSLCFCPCPRHPARGQRWSADQHQPCRVPGSAPGLAQQNPHVNWPSRGFVHTFPSEETLPPSLGDCRPPRSSQSEPLE